MIRRLLLALAVLLLTPVAHAQDGLARETAKVEDLRSIREIKRLQAEWGYRAMAGDWKGMAELGTDYVEMVLPGGNAMGREGVAQWLRERMGQGADGMPAVPVLPRKRVTLADLGRELAAPGFLVPTLVLAATTGALAVAVGFLPLLARQAGFGTVASMALVTVLAIVSSIVQPLTGAWHDRGRVSVRTGAIGGLALIAVGIGIAGGVAVGSGAMQAGGGMLLIVALVITALLVGAGVGLATPVAFSQLAASTPEERMGRTMGSAELGRELGDAGGPLVAGAVGTASLPGVGLIVVAALTVAPVLVFTWSSSPSSVRRSLAAGARGFLSKGASADDLAAAVEIVGRVDMVASAPNRMAGLPRAVAELSTREAEVLDLICQGMSNLEIADQLYVSVNSVKTYVRQIYQKIGVARRAQAVAADQDRDTQRSRARRTQGEGR